MAASSKVISRVRKLLALARSGNPHEAASAREKAETCMARHGLTEAEVEAGSDDEEVQVPIGAVGFEEPWKFKLATVAARRHGCEALGLRVGRRRKVRLVGPRVRVAAAVQDWHLLDGEVRRVSLEEVERVADLLSRASGGDLRAVTLKYFKHFRSGLVDGVKRRVRGGAHSPSTGQGTGGAVEVGVGAGHSPARVEGLVRAASGGEGGRLREKLVASGVREVSGQSQSLDSGMFIGGDPDFDELAESAYWEGVGRSSELRLGGLSATGEDERR